MIISDESKRVKEETFKNIQTAHQQMFEITQNCSKLYKDLGLGNIDIPNIIVAYNNTIINLQRQFEEAGIDFYNKDECESRFIIEYRLQALILKAKGYIDDYLSSLTITPERVDDIKSSYKKPSLPNKIFKGAKYNPEKTLATMEQKKLANAHINDYIDCRDKIYNYTVQNNIIDSILFYRTATTLLGNTSFDERIDKIDSEIQQLGFSSLKETVFNEAEKQEITFDKIYDILPITISRSDVDIKE